MFQTLMCLLERITVIVTHGLKLLTNACRTPNGIENCSLFVPEFEIAELDLSIRELERFLQNAERNDLELGQ